MNLRALDDDSLLARLDRLVRQERENVADIIEHLLEVERRELPVDRGYSTLFDYCRKKLGYSEPAAFLRIRAARAAAKFPRVIDDLRSGTLHLDAVMRLYPHLNEENCDDLLERAAGLSKREVLALTAELGAAPPVERDIIRPLSPAPSAPSSSKDTQLDPVIIAPPRMRLAFSAPDQFVKDVERLTALLRHKHPKGRLEDVLGCAVTMMLERIDPERKDRTSVRKQPAGPRRRRIPKAVKDEVFRRDEGRCSYVATDGRRCEAKNFLEFDHIVPFAVGGASDTPENIRLLCRPHNQRLARKRFGPRRRP